LTGTDTDRLPEERRRGMTIELGFAALTIGDTQFGVVDVPGHEKFVRTMVAGATGIDIALLVVAADDSVMPQTVEHVEILNLLGVSRAVVAVTKIDMVDSSMVELVSEEVRELLADTPLAGAAIRPVSSVTGAGVAELKDALLETSKRPNVQTSKHPNLDFLTFGFLDFSTRLPFRLAVDRVFTVQGRGTVVTGSVLRGKVSSGDTLEVWPPGATCRVRDLQAHGLPRELLARGQRAAINISGVDRDEIQRGAELATPGYLQPSRIVDVRLRCLATLPRPLKSTTSARLEIGTTELPVRVVLYERDALRPGESAYAQIRAGEPITAVHGQRFILRDESAMRTIGGGVVLRPVTRRKRGDATKEIDALSRLESLSPIDRVEEVLRAAGFATPTDLQVCARAGLELDDLPGIYEQLKAQSRWVAVPGTNVLAVPAAIDDLCARLTTWLERHHRAHPELPGRPIDAVLGWLERITAGRSLARPLLDCFVRERKVKLLGRFACAPAFAPALSPADEKILTGMIREIRAGRFQPPSPTEVTVAAGVDRKRIERLVTLAVALGELVRVDGSIHLHADCERELRETVADLIGKVGGVTVAQIREALQSSRKFVVPFVEYLDRIGFTKRSGDVRVLAQ
jgi:selenocysteine-specific elongation factor